MYAFKRWAHLHERQMGNRREREVRVLRKPHELSFSKSQLNTYYLMDNHSLVYFPLAVWAASEREGEAALVKLQVKIWSHRSLLVNMDTWVCMASKCNAFIAIFLLLRHAGLQELPQGGQVALWTSWAERRTAAGHQGSEWNEEEVARGSL